MSSKNPAKYDHVLLIGFGGPENAEDIASFIARVAEGRPIPAERLKEVEQHYLQVGGKSPYNAHAQRFTSALREKLKQATDAPAFLGMRYTEPFLDDVVGEIQKKNLKRGLAIILAPFRSQSSCKRYKDDLKKSLGKLQGEKPEYDFLEPWSNHDDFIEAHVDIVRQTIQSSSRSSKQRKIVFCAHSIPVEMLSACDHCQYDEEVAESVGMIMRSFPDENFQIAYQSRSGPPHQKWLGPDASEIVGDLKKEGVEEVILDPIGFIFENIEILFDLDDEFCHALENQSIAYARVPAVADQPVFIDLFLKQIQEALVA